MSVYAALLFVSAVSAHPFIPQEDYGRDTRGMTWSNFMPGGGMTLWSSANDDFWAPEPDRRLVPPPTSSDGENWGSQSIGKVVPSRDNEAPTKEPEEAADGSVAPASRPFDDDRERRPLKPSQRPSKKGYRSQEDDDRRYSGSNASVNAWFPIMFGVLPQDAKTKQSGGGESPAGPAAANEEYSDQTRSITAIANSVNHASRGLANAHTVLYAGEPPASFRRTGRSLVVLH